VSNFITWLIFTDIVKVHALSLEDTLVLADHHVTDQPPGADLNLPHLGLKFGQVHGRLGNREVV